MLENSLSNKRLAKRPRQKVLSVLLEDDEVAVVGLDFAVIAFAPNFNEETLGRPPIRHEVEAGSAHISGQIAAVLAEKGHFGLAEILADVFGEDGAELPTQFANLAQSVVEVGEEAAFVAFERRVANRNRRRDQVGRVRVAIPLDFRRIQLEKSFHFRQRLSNLK